MAENKKIPYKIYLEESEMPTQWYNVRADMKNKPAPVSYTHLVGNANRDTGFGSDSASEFYQKAERIGEKRIEK